MTSRAFAITLMLLGAGALCSAGCPSASDGGCMSGGEATVAQYEDCKQLCNQGDQDACSRRSKVEAGLSKACFGRSVTDACKALCYGRKRDQRSCSRLRQLLKSN